MKHEKAPIPFTKIVPHNSTPVAALVNSVPSPNLKPGLSSVGGHALAAKESGPDADKAETGDTIVARMKPQRGMKPRAKNEAKVKNPPQVPLLDLRHAHHQFLPPLPINLPVSNQLDRSPAMLPTTPSVWGWRVTRPQQQAIVRDRLTGQHPP